MSHPIKNDYLFRKNEPRDDLSEIAHLINHIQRTKKTHINFNGQFNNCENYQSNCLVWIKSAICRELSFAKQKFIVPIQDGASTVVGHADDYAWFVWIFGRYDVLVFRNIICGWSPLIPYMFEANMPILWRGVPGGNPLRGWFQVVNFL